MNEILCKWVSEDMMTLNNTRWEVGVPKELSEQDDLELCSEGVFHFIEHPFIAIMFKYFHGCESYTRLYEVLPEGKIIEGWDKCGATKLTLVKELEVPEVPLVQQIAFGILCALEVCKEESFVSWANNWLSGKDRRKGVLSVTSAVEACHLDDNALGLVGYTGYAAAYSAYYASTYWDKDISSSCMGYIMDAIGYCVYTLQEKNGSIDLVSIAQRAMEVY